MSDTDREPELSPIHEEIGAKTCRKTLHTVVIMDQCSNTALPVRLTFWRQHP